LAEDNPNILNKYEKYFKKKNVPYYSFLNGLLCLNKLKEHKCNKCKKIFVITDLRMPHMDGAELATELKKLNFKDKLSIHLVTAEDC